MLRVKDGLVTTSGRMTTESGKPYMKNGKHTGGGSLGEGCQNHWPSYDFTTPQVCRCDSVAARARGGRAHTSFRFTGSGPGLGYGFQREGAQQHLVDSDRKHSPEFG